LPEPERTAPCPPPLAEILGVLESRTQIAPHELARRPDAGDDMLHYLARHGGVATRMAVAANVAAPHTANKLLCEDPEEDVRAELARKIARLLPGLSRDEACGLRDCCIELIDKLARDHTPHIRAMLAEEIKRLDCVPKPIIQRLAHDAEAIVAAPILEFSPLLSDQDLIEIIASAEVERIVAAIARRQPLSADVSDAVVASLDIPALASLLANPNAAIRAETLYRIADSAEKMAAVHELIVLRADLSIRTVRRLSCFVSRSLLEQLVKRRGLDERTYDLLRRRLHERLQQEDCNSTAPFASSELPPCSWDQFEEEALERAVRLADKPALVRALARLAHAPAETVRRILDLRSPAPLVALVWKAGHSMRLAYEIQVRVMHLSPGECMAASRGKDFPLSRDEMLWQLEVFDLAPTDEPHGRHGGRHQPSPSP